MRVAIMGAGLSGLACGLILEKHGVKPTIFEKRSQVGDRFINAEIMMEVLNRPIEDSLAYLSEKFQIYLQPTSNIKKLTIHSENYSTTVEGHIGYITTRGRHEHSLESQLHKQLKTNIIFNSEHSYEELLKEYTHILLATGDGDYTKKLQAFDEALTVRLKGATVLGDFDDKGVHTWLDNNLAPKGYCYLIPFSKCEANIVVAYPNYPENEVLSEEVYWDRFYSRLRQQFNSELKIRDSFNVTNYVIGKATLPRIGNTFFVGNCLSSVMPFLGFGQFTSILTGIEAAFDLLGKQSIDEPAKEHFKSFNESLVLRRSMEKIDNQGFDTLVKLLENHRGDYIFNSKLNLMSLASKVLKPFV